MVRSSVCVCVGGGGGGGGGLYRTHEFLGGNTRTPNYHKTRIRTVTLIALLSQLASILENEAEKKLGVNLG